MATDELARLQPFKFRGIEFPTTEFRTAIRQDLAIHRYPMRDGAQIEATGRAPIEIHATIPFLTGASPGAHESWSQQTEALYPTKFRKFLNAFADRSTADLTHPELGTIRVKPSTLDSIWRSTTRDGVYVEATWLETLEDDSDKVTIGNDDYPTTVLLDSAVQLDTGLAQAPQLPKPKTSFADMARAIKAIADQTIIAQKHLFGILNQIAYGADSIIQAFRAVPSSLDWSILQSAHNVKAAANDAKQLLLTRQKDVGKYVTKSDMTFAQLSIELGANLGDLMILNGPLLASPIVPRGSTVRYYLNSSAPTIR